jgi:hypothetical protein
MAFEIVERVGLVDFVSLAEPIELIASLKTKQPAQLGLGQAPVLEFFKSQCLKRAPLNFPDRAEARDQIVRDGSVISIGER